jgi:TatD DNase family protein
LPGTVCYYITIRIILQPEGKTRVETKIHAGEKPLKFIDTHIHLQSSDYDSDLAAVLERAAAQGVERIIVPGSDMPSSQEAVAMAGKCEPMRGQRSHGISGAEVCIRAAVGFHPHDAKELKEGDISRLESMARKDEVVALGEMGLDFHYDHSPRDVQENVLRLQLRLARRVGKPLILHSRESQQRLLQILEEEGMNGHGGVIHCWSGTVKEAHLFVERGFHLGFTGVVTFKKAEELRDVVRSVPLDRILTETDGPYLAPLPFRGKRNEPAYIRYIAEELARARGIGLEEMAAAVMKNSMRCFPLLP